MGAALPLPECVPNVKTPEQRQALERAGVQLDYEAEGQYVPYKLPQGWRMLNATRGRADFPDFVIVDADNRIHFHVGGVWKGAYDNELYWTVCDEPLDVFKPEDDDAAEARLAKPENRMNTTELATVKILDAMAGNRM